MTALPRCEWWKCQSAATGYRTDIGGTTFALCPPHVNEGARRNYFRTRGTFAATNGYRKQRRKRGYRAWPGRESNERGRQR